MPIYFKLLITIILIILATQIGRYFPTLSGLIATMPLTGSIVLVLLYSDNPGDFRFMANYTKGALWGTIPSIFFFLTAYLCFRKNLPLSVTLISSFGVWFLGAFIHQLLIK